MEGKSAPPAEGTDDKTKSIAPRTSVTPVHSISQSDPLWGDKVSMLTHIYPHKPWRNIEVTMQNHQADSPLYVWPDV